LETGVSQAGVTTMVKFVIAVRNEAVPRVGREEPLIAGTMIILSFNVNGGGAWEGEIGGG
jgi:hypothetical protein